MRLIVLALAVSTLALAGCGKEEATGNTAAVDQAVSAQDFATNDSTAIDAATGADANMAADVDINAYEASGNASDGDGRSAASRRPRSSSASPSPASDASEPAPEPATPAANAVDTNSN